MMVPQSFRCQHLWAEFLKLIWSNLDKQKGATSSQFSPDDAR